MGGDDRDKTPDGMNHNGEIDALRKQAEALQHEIEMELAQENEVESMRKAVEDWKKDFDEQLSKTESRREEIEASLHDAKSSEKAITDIFVHDCLYSNELGNGILFKVLFEGRFLFSKLEGRWYLFNGQHWEKDILEHAHIAVEEVVQVYLTYARRIGGQIQKLMETPEK